ncbi:hypothetical protein V6N11_010083 [Hibiscus sabdariffa]|uniref:RNase H type-1 domain-containing protein n=1 Tax=Hibiscus sabdariffa TaxID=183260 RepID=A0ABR2PDJ5_9ROSI
MTLLHLSQSWTKHYHSNPVHIPHPPSHPQYEVIQWQLAPSGWVTLNVDDSFQPSFSMELCGILKGLRLTWANGFERIQCQTNCAEALNLVNSAEASHSPTALV